MLTQRNPRERLDSSAALIELQIVQTRIPLLLVVGLAACRGEAVEPTALGDAGDGAVVDAAADRVDVADGVSADLCDPAGNLVPNGNFASGTASWSNYGSKLQSIDGTPCGKGMRVYEVTGYGSASNSFDKVLTAGTKLRMRAFLTILPGAGEKTPALICRGHFLDDAGGDVTIDVGDVGADSSPGWRMVETSFTLPRDITGFGLLLTSRNAGSDEFAIAGVSLVVVVEPAPGG